MNPYQFRQANARYDSIRAQGEDDYYQKEDHDCEKDGHLMITKSHDHKTDLTLYRCKHCGHEEVS